MRRLTHSQKRPRSRLFIPLAALLCALSLCLPSVFARGQEAALLSGALPRPLSEDALDTRAREMPLVYALYRARFSSQNDYPDAVTGDEADAWLAALREKTSSLEDAGVLAQPLADAVRCLLSLPHAEVSGGTENGFATARTLYYDEEEKRFQTVLCVWHTGTGLIVRFSADIDAADADTAACLAAYRAYLGVEPLGDWEDGLPDGYENAAPAANHSACRSQTGQLCLLCLTRADRLMLSAFSLSF